MRRRKLAQDNARVSDSIDGIAPRNGAGIPTPFSAGDDLWKSRPHAVLIHDGNHDPGHDDLAVNSLDL